MSINLDDKRNTFISLLDAIILKFPNKTLSSIIYDYYSTSMYFNGTTIYHNDFYGNNIFYRMQAPYVEVLNETTVKTIQYSSPWIYVPVVTPKSDYKIMFKSNNTCFYTHFLQLKPIVNSNSFVCLDNSTYDYAKSIFINMADRFTIYCARILIIVKNNIAHMVSINADNTIQTLESKQISSELTLCVACGYENQSIFIEPLFATDHPFWNDLDKQMSQKCK